MADETNYYKILKVSKDAPEREIKRGYHRLAREFHPDKASSPEEQAQFEEQFALISKAYNVLKDPEKRKAFDHSLKQEAEQAAASDAPPKASGTIVAGGRTVDADRANIAQRAFAKGSQLYNMGEFARAIDFFEAAIKNNSNEPHYFAKLAQSLMKSKRSFTRAVECAERACELDSFNIDHKMVLADIYETVGSRSLAIKGLEDILKWDADNQEAQDRLVNLRSAGKGSFFKKLLARFKK